jgi:hypothetical protein
MNKYEQYQIALLKTLKQYLGIKFIHEFSGDISKLIGKQFDVILRVTRATSAFISVTNSEIRRYNKTAAKSLTLPFLR